MLTIVIRADASDSIGEGHVRRCLTVALRLKKENRVIFISRLLTGVTRQLILRGGFQLMELPSNIWANEQGDACRTIAVLEAIGGTIDRLLVDHYSLSEVWHKRVIEYTESLVVLDDLANRKVACNVLVDPTHKRSSADYSDLLDFPAVCYFGVKFAILREQFVQWRELIWDQPKVTNSIHIFFGSVDQRGYTLTISKYLLEKYPTIRIHAVVGTEFPWLVELRQLKLTYPDRFDLACQVKNMAAHMAQCNMAIGAPGGALWERSCLGIATFCFATSDNQVPILRNLDAAGFCVFGGLARGFEAIAVQHKLDCFISDEDLRARISNNCNIIDAQGAVRVAQIIVRGR